jgi:hypothetical protein
LVVEWKERSATLAKRATTPVRTFTDKENGCFKQLNVVLVCGGEDERSKFFIGCV